MVPECLTSLLIAESELGVIVVTLLRIGRLFLNAWKGTPRLIRSVWPSEGFNGFSKGFSFESLFENALLKRVLQSDCKHLSLSIPTIALIMDGFRVVYF